MRALPDIVKQLIVINALFFVGTFLINPGITAIATDLLALHYPSNNRFGIWQIVTHMFMHGGVTHILFNMFGLWMFGSPLAQMWGKNKFLFFYISAGLGAAILQLAMNYVQVSSITEQLVAAGFSESSVLELLQTERYSTAWQVVISEQELMQLYTSFNFSMVGASGALYGVLVAFAFLFPNAELMLLFLPIPIKAKYFVPGVVLLDTISALTGRSFFSPSNTAFIAHIGGALTGFIIMWYWKRNQFNQNRWDA